MCIGRHLETCNTGPKATPLRLVQSSQPGNAHKLNWQAISSEGSGSMADESLIVSSPFALLPLPLPPPPPLSPAYTYFYTCMHTPVGHSKPQLLLSNLPTKIFVASASSSSFSPFGTCPCTYPCTCQCPFLHVWYTHMPVHIPAHTPIRMSKHVPAHTPAHMLLCV